MNDLGGVFCAAVGLFPFVLIGVLLLGALVSGGTSVGGRRFDSLEDFVAKTAVSTGLEADARRDGWGLCRVLFTGRLASGRFAKIWFERHQAGKTYYYTVQLAVAADSDVKLEVTPEGLLAQLGSWLGLVKDVHTGDERFDERYWIESKTEGRALRAMSSGLKPMIERLFEVRQARKLAADRGWLELTIHAGSLDPFDYRRVLQELELAARTFDRVPLEVRVLGSVRKAVRDARGGTRCAYCHDGIDGREEGLVACERCHTVLHDECWRELAHCPLLGCAGRRPERAHVGRARG